MTYYRTIGPAPPIGQMDLPDAATVIRRMSGLGALGQEGPTLAPAVLTCPHCSYATENGCVVCMPGDEHPACEDCEGPKHKPPWYKTQVAYAVYAAAIVSLGSAILVGQLRNRTNLPL